MLLIHFADQLWPQHEARLYSTRDTVGSLVV